MTGTGTGKVASGRKLTFTAPDAAGPYPFVRAVHPWMKGALTVR